MPSITTYCMTWFCLNIQRAYILLSGFNLAYRHFEREVNFNIVKKINKSVGLNSKQDVLLVKSIPLPLNLVSNVNNYGSKCI